jgi:hypothetical protein
MNRPVASGIPVWRREVRASQIGPFYRSSYLHVFLTGKLEDGRDVALVAGTHSDNYPYFHPDSSFDDVLLLVGPHSYLVTAREIPSLGISLGPRDAASVQYNGQVTLPDDSVVPIDFHFNLTSQTYRPKSLGIGTGAFTLGLLWQPALIVGNGSITIKNERLRIAKVVGEMERGSLLNVRGSAFQFGYEYFATARTTDVPVAFVKFHTYALHHGANSWLLRLLLKFSPAREAVTLEGERPHPGDPFALAGAGAASDLLVGHSVDLGPAVIHRQLVRVRSMPHSRIAFHERIEAKHGA